MRTALSDGVKNELPINCHGDSGRSSLGAETVFGHVAKIFLKNGDGGGACGTCSCPS